MRSSFTWLPGPPSWGVLLLVAVLPILAGCEDESLLGPEPQASIFTRYVSLGNSITAGFQAGGINQTTQQQAYPVLLANQMDTPFNVPALRDPGCPPPLTSLFPPERLASVECALRASPTPTRINNVAVPSARVVDGITNDVSEGASPNALTTFILGGRTQAEAAAEINPTFASVWLGNNDVLTAGLTGNPNLVTPPSTFQSQYTQVIDELEAAGVQAGVIASVANVTVTPVMSTAQAYGGAEQQINQLGQQVAANDGNPNTNWGSYEVADNCGPGQLGPQTRVAFQYGFVGLFSLALLGRDVELDCSDNRTLAEIYGQSTLEQLGLSVVGPFSILTPAETQQLLGVIQSYNTALEQIAGSRNWAFVDVNPTWNALYAAGTDTPADPSDDLVPKFPNLTPGEPTFGQFFSEDGIHPSAATHRLVTNLFIEAINNQYNTSLQPIEAPSVPGQ